MVSVTVGDLELTAEARTALGTLADALADLPQFAAFEQAGRRLGADEAAQAAIEAYQTNHRSVEPLLRLNALGLDDRAELERLETAIQAQDSVTAYDRAYAELAQVFQAVAARLSPRLGIDYRAACRAGGCC